MNKILEGKFTVNGNEVTMKFKSHYTLLDTLRENGFIEVKGGCLEGACGSCIVLINDELQNSCQVLTGSVLGTNITTVKGIGTIHKPHPLQEALVETSGVQCGFCTPGKVLSAYALLKKNKDPKEEDIKLALDGNLCRCTGYVKIVEAVELAARRIRENG